MREPESRADEERREPVSTRPFHELANRALEISRQIFATAREQVQLGDEIESGGPPIDELADAQGPKAIPIAPALNQTPR